MYFLLVILGMLFSFTLLFTGMQNKNSDIISIGSVLSIFFLLIFINIYIPDVVHSLKTGLISISSLW
ncbi:hypothetical protein [Clostridium sp. AWRP]|uniref:hypothetical protein n=1 Tax=Clostridium sp. AWRP TaxID=2212991 RepID=UPI000FDAA43C|nr:hypothetical protein [Clostridium sp. AWRP]AZV56293.1 hypothetical protein DMR38_06560 [Clostridium sp. AWRP]